VEQAYEQEAWKAAKEPPKRLPRLDDLRRLREEAEERRRARKPIPRVELAPTGRAKCKECGESLEKDSPRVVLGRSVEFGNQERVGPINVHPRCVRRALQAVDSATEPDGLPQALRENSPDFPAERFPALLAEIGDLGEG
jgi:hypothetical protein